MHGPQIDRILDWTVDQFGHLYASLCLHVIRWVLVDGVVVLCLSISLFDPNPQLLIGSPFYPVHSFHLLTTLNCFATAGSFLFMTIEGGAMDTHTILASTTSRQLHPYDGGSRSSSKTDEDVEYVKYPQNEQQSHHIHQHQHHNGMANISFSPAAMEAATEERHKTVENIWDITVSLNILYRDNWTRYVQLQGSSLWECLNYGLWSTT